MGRNPACRRGEEDVGKQSSRIWASDFTVFNQTPLLLYFILFPVYDLCFCEGRVRVRDAEEPLKEVSRTGMYLSLCNLLG